MLRGILTILMLCPLGALAQSARPDPLSLQTRDAHQDLLIVADPYLSAERYNEVFGKKSPYAAGLIVIEVYFRNDNTMPIRLNPGTIQLVISIPGEERQRLSPLSPEEVADRTLLKGDKNPSSRRHFPFPGSPTSTGHGKEWQEMVTTVGSMVLSTDILPPRATTHGLLFFDMDHDFDAIRNTHLYIPDLAFMTDHKALFFFEIDLADAPMR
jgi:hypothetical protein